MTTLDEKIEKVLKEFDNKLTNEWVGFYNKGNDLIQIKTPEIYNFLRSSIRQVVEEMELKLRQQIKIEIAQLDWIKILSEAIKGRPMSWGNDIVREWRNASDEVWVALDSEAIKKGVWKDVFSNQLQNHKKYLKEEK